MRLVNSLRSARRRSASGPASSGNLPLRLFSRSRVRLASASTPSAQPATSSGGACSGAKAESSVGAAKAACSSPVRCPRMRTRPAKKASSAPPLLLDVLLALEGSTRSPGGLPDSGRGSRERRTSRHPGSPRSPAGGRGWSFRRRALRTRWPRPAAACFRSVPPRSGSVRSPGQDSSLSGGAGTPSG